MGVSILLAIFGIIIVLEGAMVILYPDKTKKMLNKLSKNKTLLIKLGLIEVLIGILLLLLSTMI